MTRPIARYTAPFIRAAALGLVLVGLLAGAAFAQPADDIAQAAELKAGADQAFLDGDFELSLQRLKAAYALDPQPGYIGNQGLVYERLGRYAEAVDALRRFLESAPGEGKAARAREIITRLTPETRFETDPPGAEVFIDDQPASLGRTPLTVRLVAGAHTAEMRQAGFAPWRRPIKVLPVEGLTVRAALSPIAVEPPPAVVSLIDEPRRPGSSAATGWAYVAFAGAALAATTGGVCYALGLDAVDARQSAATGTDWDAAQRQVEQFDLGLTVSAAVASTALVTGVVLLIVGDQPAVTVQPTPTGAALQGRF